MDEKMAGERIRKLRDRKAWTQEHLADAARVSVRTVQRAEEGTMSAETLSALAGALDVPVTEITKPASAPYYPQITPFLFYEKLESIDWLVRVFGFKTRMLFPGEGGRIDHAELTLGDGLIMAASPKGRAVVPAAIDGKHTQGLYVMVEDADAHCAHARAQGATIVEEPMDAHGHRRYTVNDPEGHGWMFYHPISQR